MLHDPFERAVFGPSRWTLMARRAKRWAGRGVALLVLALLVVINLQMVEGFLRQAGVPPDYRPGAFTPWIGLRLGSSHRCCQNCTAAAGGLRTVQAAQERFRRELAREPGVDPRYARSLAELPGLDPELASGRKAGYRFRIGAVRDPSGRRLPLEEGWAARAAPATPSTGDRWLYADHTGRMTYSWFGPAGPDDTPIR